jgi:hypothetical protein
LAKALIPPAATAIPKSSRVGRERLIISLPNSGNPTKKPINQAIAIALKVPMVIAIKA